MNTKKENGNIQNKNNMKLIINLNENNRGIKFKRNLFIKQNDIYLLNLLKKKGVLEEVKILYSKNPIPKQPNKLPKIEKNHSKQLIQKILSVDKTTKNKEEKKNLDISLSLPLKSKSPKFENLLLKRNDSLNRDNCIQCIDNNNNMRQILFNINKRSYDNIIHINNINKRNDEKAKILNNFSNFSFQNLIKSQSSRNLKQSNIIKKLNNPLTHEDKLINKSVNNNLKSISIKKYMKQIHYDTPIYIYNEKGSQTLREEINPDSLHGFSSKGIH